jgi:hypothetical protein
MFAALLMTIAILSPPPTSPQVLAREDVRLSVTVGDSTWLVLDTKDTILVPTSLLSLSPEGDLVIDGDASVLTSQYVDAQGVNHTVTTDCRRYSDAQACANAHAAMLAKIRVLFPPPPH